MKKLIISIAVFLVLTVIVTQVNTYAKKPKKAKFFTQTEQTPVDANICPTTIGQGSQNFRSSCPIGAVLVAGQCTIEPPISNQQGIGGFIEINQEIDDDHSTDGDRDDVGSATSNLCFLRCGISNTSLPAPVIPNDAEIVSTVLCVEPPS